MSSSFFKDSNDNIVLLQRPNLVLLVWLISVIVKSIADGLLRQTADVVASVAIIIWAGLELFTGVNYFRRLLGLIVLVLNLYGWLS